MHNAAQPVLIDTDIGDDVDDAFALALAAVLPQLRVCAVTTVAGPVADRARLAACILSAANQPDVPVVPGSSAMRNGRPGPAKFSHAPLVNAGLVVEQGGFETATEAILDSARRCAPLTIIALGPLTNIAAALDADPTLAQRARLVAMAGSLGIPYPDWNLRCDPAAARAVLASGMPIAVVGFHLTRRTKMPLAQLRRLFSDGRPLSQMLTRCVLAWRTSRRRIPILHDALTVAVAADAGIVRRELREMRVFFAGFSRARRSSRPNVQVCTAVDMQRYEAMLDRYLLGEPNRIAPPDSVWRRLIHHLA